MNFTWLAIVSTSLNASAVGLHGGVFWELDRLIPSLISRMALVWQEGLLIDFLQKKLSDRWVRNFLLLSANLFNEKLIFETLYRVYHIFFLQYMTRYGGGDYETTGALFTGFLTFLVMFTITLLFWHVLMRWAN